MLNMVKNYEEYLVRDPVCGMHIHPEYAADLDFYKGRILYFCSFPCKEKFVADPEKYFTAIPVKFNENEQSSE